MSRVPFNISLLSGLLVAIEKPSPRISMQAKHTPIEVLGKQTVEAPQ
jgi:hypothetical protein